MSKEYYNKCNCKFDIVHATLCYSSVSTEKSGIVSSLLHPINNLIEPITIDSWSIVIERSTVYIDSKHSSLSTIDSNSI